MLTITRPGLWPHQIEAVNATVSALSDAERTTTVMACGTGKTRVGAAVAGYLAEHAGVERILFVAPFLDLITQMVGEWRHVLDTEALGRVVAVCSDQDVLREHQHDLRKHRALVTSDPVQLAALTADRSRVTVASTYQSLPVLVAAHDEHGLPMWDLIVIDEAHRSVGRSDKVWGVIHSNAHIPAARRLYMTATPKVIVSPGDDAVSMDDEKVFGQVGYRLPFSTAIELGLLANYQVVVPVVTDEQVRAAALQQGSFYQSGRSAVSGEMLATQVAVLRAAREYGIRRMITFHNRVAYARWFASTLPRAAGLLTPEDRPVHVWADHVHGTQPLASRRRVVDRLRGDDDGLVVVSNARVLGEGVDVPAVDSVAFIDSRSSPIDTIQAIGRALRQGRSAGPKTAFIIVPVLLGSGEDPETALNGSAYAPVWQVIRAMAAHDDTLASQLGRLRRQLGREDARTTPMELPHWLRITGVPVPAGFARAITVRFVRASSTPWEEYYGAAQAYQAAHGNLLIPQEWQTPTGLHLGTWMHRQRQEYRRGILRADRIAALEKLDMVWDTMEFNRNRVLAHLEAFRSENGHLFVPDRYVTTGEQPFRLGSAVTDIRVRYRQGRLDPQFVTRLEAIGFIWSVTDTSWQQFLADLKAYRLAHPDLDIPQNYQTPGPKPRNLGAQVCGYRATTTTAPCPKTPSKPSMSWDSFGMPTSTAGISRFRHFADTKSSTATPIRPIDTRHRHRTASRWAHGSGDSGAHIGRGH